MAAAFQRRSTLEPSWRRVPGYLTPGRGPSSWRWSRRSCELLHDPRWEMLYGNSHKIFIYINMYVFMQRGRQHCCFTAGGSLVRLHDLAASVWVFSRYSTVQRQAVSGVSLTGDSKLVVCLFVFALWQCWPVPVYPASLLMAAGVGSRTSCDPELDKWKRIDGFVFTKVSSARFPNKDLGRGFKTFNCW